MYNFFLARKQSIVTPWFVFSVQKFLYVRRRIKDNPMEVKYRSLREREYKTVLDPGFQRREFRIPDTGFQSLTVELGFWIPNVSGIPDSFSCISDSTALDSRPHKQNFRRFWIPQAKISRVMT